MKFRRLSMLPLLFLIHLLAIQQHSASALKCNSCDGLCDCRDNQLPETCADGAVCYTVKASLSGQVLRKGCTPHCKHVASQGWQKCHLCDGDNLCNNDEYRAGLFVDCAMEELLVAGFGLPQPSANKKGQQQQQQPQHYGYGYGQQQYRRSLISQYGGDSAQGGGVGGQAAAMSPQAASRTDDAYGISSASRNDGSGGGYDGGGQNPQQSAQQARPNSYLVRQPAVVNGGSSSGEDSSAPLSPGITGGAGGLTGRVNAFLDRMSPRSVPIGFPQGSDGRPAAINAFGSQQPWGAAQQNAGFNSAQPNQQQPAAAVQFGGGVSSPKASSPDFGQGIQEARVNSSATPSSSNAVHALLLILAASFLLLAF